MSAPRGRRAAVALGAGAAAVAAAWASTRPSAPPLYDSIQPAAPYLYYCVPHGYDQSRAPKPLSQSTPVSNGQVQGGVLAVSTDEPPISQVQILVAGDTLNIPPGATEITATIAPVPPPATLPADGQLDGNVYTVSVSSGGQPLHMKSGQNWTIVLRGDAGKGQAFVEQLVGSTWHRSDLQQPVGQPDTYAANFTSFGTFALVLPGPAATPQPCQTFAAVAGSTSSGAQGAAGSGGSGSGILPIVGIVGALAVLGGAVLALRARGGSRRTPD